MEYRHEVKHPISLSDMFAVRSRLKALTEPDDNAHGGKYTVRSLYFDDLWDSALMEKINGVSRREKFRLRYYNGDTSFIRLERKSRLGGLCSKQGAGVTRQEVAALLEGDTGWMEQSAPIARQLHIRMRDGLLRPRVIVNYTREPFIYRPGNVRVTLDYDIRAGLSPAEFLNPDYPTVAVEGEHIIMEVKWDGFLPDVIRDAVQLDRRASAFSKYAACRIFG